MRCPKYYSTVLLVASLLAFVAAHGTQAADNNKVVVLNEKTFDEAVNDKHHYVLVNFFATWSQKSRDFSSEYAKVPELLTKVPNMTDGGLHDKVMIAKLNAVKYEAIARKLHIRNFPTVVLFHGKFSDHVFYASDHHNAVGNHIYTAEDVVEFTSTLVLAHHDEERLSDEAKRLHDETNIPHPGVGQVYNVSDDTFQKYILDPKKTCFVMFYSKWCTHCHEMHPILQEIAEYFKGQHKVIIARMDGEENPSMMEKLKIDGFPEFYIFNRGEDGEHPMKFGGHRDYEHIRSFIDTQHTEHGSFRPGFDPFSSEAFDFQETNHANEHDQPHGHDGMESEHQAFAEGEVMDEGEYSDGADAGGEE